MDVFITTYVVFPDRWREIDDMMAVTAFSCRIVRATHADDPKDDMWVVRPQSSLRVVSLSGVEKDVVDGEIPEDCRLYIDQAYRVAGLVCNTKVLNGMTFAQALEAKTLDEQLNA